ncbi:MAG: 5'/3'-nucleotidase SurE [Paludibacteraceae bacterium]|nr:5'/3'-nucleotidase SurE [Paludibacteraceae bacterium]
MEILITNDDGWGAQGIVLLSKLMTKLGHVTVVAPDGPRSSMSNAISMGKPMTMDKIDLASDERFTPEEKARLDVYISNGMPSDCVKLALNVLFDDDPDRIDLMVSGINHGSNASVNVVYSGTMGACFTGVEHHIRSIGLSIYDNNQPTDLSNFEPYIVELCRHLRYDIDWHWGMCYNINAPVGEIVGMKWTRQCRGHWEKEIVGKPNAEGKTEYWLKGNFVNEEPDAEDTDEWAIAHHFISIQPCTVDMTFYAAL